MRFAIFLVLLTILHLSSGFTSSENSFFHEGILLEIPEEWKVKESGTTGEGWSFATFERKDKDHGSVTIKWIASTLDLDKILNRYTNEMEYQFSENPEGLFYKITEGVYHSKRALKAKYQMKKTIPFEGTIYCFHYCERTFLYIEEQSTSNRTKNSEAFYQLSSSLSCVEETD